MAQYKFVENLNQEQFSSLIGKPNIKTHFLGSWEWGEVCSKRNWIPHYIGVEKDGELVATALLLQRKLYFGFSYFYIPRGFTMDYTDIDLLKFFTESIHAYCKKRNSVFFKIDPDIKLHTLDMEGNIIEGENNYTLVKELENMGYKHKELTYYFETEQPRYTFRVPLDGTVEEVFDKYGRTTKNCLKTAKESGVEVYIGGPEDLKKFTDLMEITERRQDFFSHESEYYSYFYDIFKKGNMCDLYLAKINIPFLIQHLEERIADLQSQIDRFSEMKSKKAKNKKRDAEEKLKPLLLELDKLKQVPEKEVVVSAYMNVNYDKKSWTLYAGNDMEYRKFYGNYLVYQKQIEDAIANNNVFF